MSSHFLQESTNLRIWTDLDNITRLDSLFPMWNPYISDFNGKIFLITNKIKRQFLTDELEVMKMIGVDIGGGVDLQRVVVLVRVLKQTVHRVQHLKVGYMQSFFLKTMQYQNKCDMIDQMISRKKIVKIKFHLMGNCEEPFTCHTSIIKTLLPPE